MSMLKKKAFERATIGEVIHKLENLEELLKTAKISTVALKSIRTVDKNAVSEHKCREHGQKVEYLKDSIGYCAECVD